MRFRLQILTLLLVLAASAAVAALSGGTAGPARPASIPEWAAPVAEPAIPRVVVIGRRPRAAIARLSS